MFALLDCLFSKEMQQNIKGKIDLFIFSLQNLRNSAKSKQGI